MNEQEFSELAAGDALNALSPEEQRSYRAAIDEHPEWNEIVVQDAATAAELARGVAQETPPVAVRGALLELITRTPQHPLGSDATDPALTGADASAPSVEPTTTDAVQTVARRSWMRGVFALAASLALLVTLGFGAALIGQQLGRSPAVVALDRIEDASDSQTAGVTVDGGGEATAVWSESLGEVVVVTDGIPALGSGQTYQLWFLRDDLIVSAGLFTTDREGEATALLDGTVEPGDTIAVSVEPAGGSEQPTTEPIVAIPTDA